jgi:hypothetical protein
VPPEWKIPITELGIEPATFRFVPQCLNELRYGVTLWKEVEEEKKIYFFCDKPTNAHL